MFLKKVKIFLFLIINISFYLGFNPNDVALNKYGHSLHFWDWSKRKYLKTIDLGTDGSIPLELRFCS